MMYTKMTGWLAAAALCAFALPGNETASAADRAERGTFQVQIDMPPSRIGFFEEDINDAFVGRVRQVFRRQGYEGKITEVRNFEEPDPGCCLLTINLIEWRGRHAQNVECTFTANLQTEATTRNLGVFTDTAFRWIQVPGRFGLAETFGEAAEGAIRQLYDRLEETELIPGLRDT